MGGGFMLEFDDAPKGLVRLIYASRAQEPGRGGLPEMVRTILLKSIQNNRMAAVTGFLVAGEGRFLQLLEGPASEVEQTFERIRRDDRHADVQVISRGAVERRMFRDWNMAQHQIVAADRSVLTKVGLTAFTPDGLDEARALTLLTTFGAQHLR
ncbi:hypothetical protein ASD89_11565 [Caulobacter sp. Root656]|nr:hypothetical protein ASD89_11565 [Caulobacter sp. Root656]